MKWRLQLLDDDRVEIEIAAGAAIFLRDGGAEDARGAGLEPDLARRHAGLLPRRVMGQHLGRDELAHRVAELLVLGREDGAGEPAASVVAHARLCPGPAPSGRVGSTGFPAMR